MKNDVAAFAAVTAVGAAARFVFFTAEMHHAVAAFAGSYVNIYLVNEHASIITGEPHGFLAGVIFCIFVQICHVFIMISPLIAGIIGVGIP